MNPARSVFSSRLGFILAASGSAVGLGNVWSFPTQTANNGGAAFVAVYLLLAFLLAYPALMAELVIGRYSRANIVNALQGLSHSKASKAVNTGVAYYGVMIAALILSFYTIVAGWMLAHCLEPLFIVLGLTDFSQWIVKSSFERDLLCCSLFAILTMLIIANGVEAGIEKWSKRLMPLLVLLLIGLIIYVLFQPGAKEGLKIYLLPDTQQLLSPSLLISALGQAFFSLSLGVGTMLIYGSYISKHENLAKLGAIVTMVDVGIAFTAGLLIIPAIYVAQYNGANIFNDSGELIAGPGLIFQVLPALFNSMENHGLLVGGIFFALMSIAALTSSISMLEVPVSVAIEKTSLSRRAATLIIGGSCLLISLIISANFDALFGSVVSLTTQYSEPLLGILFCLYAGWALHRNQLLHELKQGYPAIETSFFWKIWPWYIRIVCPTLIALTFIQGL